jgi:hypothetical protein
MNAPELVRRVEYVGGALRLEGDRIRYDLPEEAEALLPELRQLRDEMFAFLRQRPSIPPLPSGVSIIKWAPKEAPVVLTRCSVVVDVKAFIDATLRELEASCKGKQWLAGNRSRRDLCERLEQVGVLVEITGEVDIR